MTERRAIVIFFALLSCLAQNTVSDNQTRWKWDRVLLSYRPTTSGGESPQATENRAMGDALLGITVWRLPAPKPGSKQIPGLKPAPKATTKLERVSPSSPLNAGDRFRITIETSRGGYLYVLKKWGFLDSDDYVQIVYPPAASAGQNPLPPGAVIAIPPAQSEPAYLQAGGGFHDSYYVLLTSRPLPDVASGPQRDHLNSGLLNDWIAVWDYPVSKLDDRHVSPAITANEAQILSGKLKALQADDPLPEDLYHSEAPVGEPVMVSIEKSIAPDPPRQLRPRFGGFQGISTPRPQSAAPAPPRGSRITAGSLLTSGQDEPPGGLYSYILFGSRPESFDSPRWNRYFQTILAYLNLPSAGDAGLYTPAEKLNLTFLPLTCSAKELPVSNMQPVTFQFTPARVEAHRMEHLATGKPFAGHGKSNADTACALVSSYDYSRAQRLLALLAGAHLEGPYIISTAQPLSKAGELPAQYLYQDLSNVPPDLVGLWFREFMAQAQEPEFWKTRSADQFVLRLRTVIGIASEQVPDFRSSVVWAFIAPPKK